MANSARSTSGANTETEYPDLNPMDGATVFYEKNKKWLNALVAVVVIGVGGYFGYMKMVKEPKVNKAAASLYWPQLYMQADSLNMALNGDGKNMGFVKIAKTYSGTEAGNLAKYYEGVCYLKMGDFPKAIAALKSFDGKGTMLGRQVAGSLGMAYMESGDAAKAIESFKQASSDKDDIVLTPLYLYHLGIAYQTSGKTNEAKEVFRRIRDEFPRSQQARDMDKQLAELGELN